MTTHQAAAAAPATRPQNRAKRAPPPPFFTTRPTDTAQALPESQVARSPPAQEVLEDLGRRKTNALEKDENVRMSDIARSPEISGLAGYIRDRGCMQGSRIPRLHSGAWSQWVRIESDAAHKTSQTSDRGPDQHDRQMDIRNALNRPLQGTTSPRMAQICHHHALQDMIVFNACHGGRCCSMKDKGRSRPNITSGCPVEDGISSAKADNARELFITCQRVDVAMRAARMP